MGAPAPRFAEQRRHPRVELFATVELRSGDDSVLLPVINISLGGVYVAGDGADTSRLAVGSEHDLSIFDDDGEHCEQVRGRVVRRDTRGVAFCFVGPDDTFKVACLINDKP